jgi:DoxX-like family
MQSSMVVPSTTETNRIGRVPISLRQSMPYWIPTLYVALTSLVAGTTAILHAPPLYEEMLRLGYPPHFATLLGVWKILGVVALLAPGLPLAKEWAYAGFFIDFSAGIVAYAATGGGVVSYIGPVASLGALVVSWYLRPRSRRLAETSVKHGN